ncbi:putative uncharacterized protein [Waddlia chondrophila 2032/99]|uniref:Lipoprotein n=1 Tax=Waddlia chondrophila 2032/99 TaxID=765953 RepID=F8LFK3_9BACT|nr:hypothetical protein [Waddlia chondrophila]CCB92271.1 putative uncharacterized protein [Waddlia chondrophila 2032/99]
MMDKMTVVLLVALVFLTSCSAYGWKMSESSRMAYEMVDELTDPYEELYGLRLSGISEAAPDGKYDNLGMDFHTYRRLSKDEGRRLILTIMDEFLDKINNTQAFRKHLTVHPFDSNHIVINIFVKEKEKGEKIFFPNYKCFSIYNEKIYYDFYLKEIGYDWRDEQEEMETIEEARRIVESQNQS